LALHLGGLTLLFAVHFWVVKPSNMGGFEWPKLHLASRGIIDFPQANRPLTLLFDLPPALVRANDLRSYLVTEWAYLLGGAGLLYALVRRRLPEWPAFALLVTAVLLTWVPMDHARLQSTVIVGYVGSTLCALGILLLLFESWQRGSALMLLAGSLAAVLLSRVSEAVLPLLAGAPLLWTPYRPFARFRAWVLAWGVALLIAVALALPTMRSGSGSYQAALGLDPHPLHVLERLRLQFGYHLAPLFTSPLAELRELTVGLAVFVFSVLWWLSLRKEGDAGLAPARALRAAGTGLLFAGLGYSAFVLGATFVTPVRTQILAGPGIALLLSGSACALFGGLPPRLRMVAIGAFGAWVVAVGTGRTIALQRDWDRFGRFPAQRALLSELVALAPETHPHTLFVLLDDAQTFPAVFAFRHAVEYMYARQASGLAWGAPSLFYPFSFDAAGVGIEPSAKIREAWEEPATHYAYEEIVVLAYERGGLHVLDEWPAPLPPLPPGARYIPRARLILRDPHLPSRAILRER
jgi:hypothetical protein